MSYGVYWSFISLANTTKEGDFKLVRLDTENLYLFKVYLGVGSNNSLYQDYSYLDNTC